MVMRKKILRCFNGRAKSVGAFLPRACGVNVLLLLALMPPVWGSETDTSERARFHALAVEESLAPVRPGVPEKSPFWNRFSRRFMYAPSFGLRTVKYAESYRFTVTSKKDNEQYVFEAEVPWAPLTPIWKELPVGEMVLKVEGLSRKGGPVRGMAGRRMFHRAAVFGGPYHKQAADYRESARRALQYLFKQRAYQTWKTVGRPDPTYGLYRYPSKIISAVIGGMTMYAALSPRREEADDALQIARSAAEYLIRVSEPAGAPLEFLPPTYAGRELAGGDNKGQMMLNFAATVGHCYLDLYDATKEGEFFEAARRIADTYKKLQLPSGSWPLKVKVETGEPTTENLCTPTGIINFLDRLDNQYGLDTYRETSKLALRWIMENPMKTFDWSGQFEDQRPRGPYENLAAHPPCKFSIYLFEHAEENPQYTPDAEELLRFAEDQFVVWEHPSVGDKRWITPCVLEQYRYYVPIDASAASMISSYQKAYEVTGKELYLAKARALADTLTVLQDRDTGRYPTYWDPDVAAIWINCVTYDAKVMLDLGRMLSTVRADAVDGEE